jgi:hypothetical protein
LSRDYDELLYETKYIIAYLSNISITIEGIVDNLSNSNDTSEDICQYHKNIANSFTTLKAMIQDYNLTNG